MFCGEPLFNEQSFGKKMCRLGECYVWWLQEQDRESHEYSSLFADWSQEIPLGIDYYYTYYSSFNTIPC